MREAKGGRPVETVEEVHYSPKKRGRKTKD
jgi:hypothetical protein